MNNLMHVEVMGSSEWLFAFWATILHIGRVCTNVPPKESFTGKDFITARARVIVTVSEHMFF